MDPTDTIRGIDLRHLRNERGVSQTAVSRQHGTSRNNITRLEREARPTGAAVSRYLAALDAAVRERDAR
jgi:transcriptional regulator with XRE-family HTH domain